MGKVIRLGLLQKLFMNIKQLGCNVIISVLLTLRGSSVPCTQGTLPLLDFCTTKCFISLRPFSYISHIHVRIFPELCHMTNWRSHTLHLIILFLPVITLQANILHIAGTNR